MPSRIRHDEKNHRRLLKSSNLMRIVVPVLTHRSDGYQRSYSHYYTSKNYAAELWIIQGVTSPHTKEIIQSQRRTLQVIQKLQALDNLYTIVTTVLRSFPQCKAKEAPIPVMSSHDPPAAQHMTIVRCVIAGTSQRVMDKQQRTHTRQ